MIFRNILAVLLTLFSFVNIKAQSYEMALDYYNTGEYLQAAKILRPLADGGDARAQALAAQLFFEGYGVSKNISQGIKYATLAANQGNEEGVNQLSSYYVGIKDFKKAYNVLHEYVEVKHPHLLKENIGARLGLYYITGGGVAKDEDKGWSIIQKTEFLDFYKEQLPDSWKAYEARHPELNDIDQMPSFPGGASALNSFLSQEVNYPTMALRNKVQGRVVVSFVVERDGSISSPEIVRSIDPALDKEAKRVVMAMPKWNPAKKKNGNTVRVKYTIPITFRL